MPPIDSNNILKNIIALSKLKVLSNQHILSRFEFTNIQLRLIDKFEEMEIRIIGDKVILNIPNNLKFTLSECKSKLIKATKIKS
jgi:hypothetical protein